jgi:hypothetical protein
MTKNIHQKTQLKTNKNHSAKKESWQLFNLRAPSDDADLLDPLERLRQQREQVPPTPHDILKHKPRINPQRRKLPQLYN